MFCGHEDFKKVMTRNRFQFIRSSLTLKADTLSGDTLSSMYPLHSCRRLLDTIGKPFAEIAVPVETCALDEASCRSKASNRANSFIPNKPDKFAICFIAMLVLQVFIFIPYSTMDGETFRRYLKSKDIIIFIGFSDRY